MKRRCGRRTWTWAMLTCLLVAVAIILCVPCSAAEASTSSSGADQDYGWLHRKGDYLYYWDDNGREVKYLEYSPQYRRWYRIGQSCYSCDPGSVQEYYWNDGTICIQYNLQVRLESIIAQGKPCTNGKWLPSSIYSGVVDSSIGASERSRLRWTFDSNTGENLSGNIRLVVFDREMYGRSFSNFDRVFKGLYNLTSIEGLGHIGDSFSYVRSMVETFSGCAELKEIDLSNIGTTQCTNFSDMLAGCVSLERLTLGERWSQAFTRHCLMEQEGTKRAAQAIEEAASQTPDGGEGADESSFDPDAPEVPEIPAVGTLMWEDERLLVQVGPDIDDIEVIEAPEHDDRYATFPVAMTCVRDGQVYSYQAGDVIPDGPGIYESAEPLRLNDASLRLLSSDGSEWVAAAWENLPSFVCTGEPIEPTVRAELGGSLLQEGIDYELTYHNTVEKGVAEVVVRGIGGVTGQVTLPYRIVDNALWAFLYDNGLLCIKKAHSQPSSQIVSSETPLLSQDCWFSVGDEDAGSTVPWADDVELIRRVYIDASCKTVPPATMAGWFAGCVNLESVEGMGNIKASRVSSMAGLFRGCAKLKELDLSGLKTSRVADFSGLVAGCSSLERIVLQNLDLTNAKTSTGAFDGCDRLEEVTFGYGWKNAALASARLELPATAYKIASSSVRLPAKTAVPDGAGTYRMSGIALKSCSMGMDKDSYACTGKPIKPKLMIKLGDVALTEGVDYAVSYANNVYSGTAKATVTGKGAFSGSVVVPFKIVSRVTQVGDRLVIKNRTGTFVVKVTKVSKDGKAAEVAVVSVQAQPAAKYLSLPSECTIGNVKVSVTTVSSKLTGNFRNVTSVVIGAKVTTIGAKAFSKATKVRTLVVKSARLKTVKNCLSGSKVTKVTTKVSLSNTKRRTYKRWFTSRSTVGKSVSYSYG